MELDHIHIRMLELLRADARASVASIAQAVGVSRANAYARMAALENAGVIRGYQAVVSPREVGKSIAALIFVSLWQDQWADFRTRLKELPQLDYFAVTTGQLDAMLLVRAVDVESIHELVVEELAKWPSIKATETVFLMDEESFDWSLHPGQTSAPTNRSGDPGSSRFIPAPSDRPKR